MASDSKRQLAVARLEDRLKHRGKNALMHGGEAICPAMGTITLPLLARHSANCEYGALAFLLATGAIVTEAMVFGQDSAMVRYYHT